MRASEVREHSTEELNDLLHQMRMKLFQLRTEFQTDEEPDTTEKSKLKKDIARVLTVLKERELEMASAGGVFNKAESEADK